MIDFFNAKRIKQILEIQKFEDLKFFVHCYFFRSFNFR